MKTNHDNKQAMNNRNIQQRITFTGKNLPEEVPKRLSYNLT